MEDLCKFYTNELENIISVGHGKTYLVPLVDLIDQKINNQSINQEQRECLIGLREKIMHIIQGDDSHTFLGGSGSN